ncbi:MAG: cytochrome c3 family protein, partial [bacterium]
GTFKAETWKDGRHNKAELSCAKCHSGHSKYDKFILLETDVKLCATCHADVGAAFEKGEHGKNDAGLTCSKCHDPHN